MKGILIGFVFSCALALGESHEAFADENARAYPEKVEQADPIRIANLEEYLWRTRVNKFNIKDAPVQRILSPLQDTDSYDTEWEAPQFVILHPDSKKYQKSLTIHFQDKQKGMILNSICSLTGLKWYLADEIYIFDPDRREQDGAGQPDNHPE